MHGNGEVVIVWEQSGQIFRSEYRDGSWTDPTGLSDNISPNTLGAEAPQVALSSNGDAVIVWHQGGGSDRPIFRSEYRFGF
jgi:hypothetical protein